MCVYRQHLLLKEAVIRKPHLFMLNVEQLPSVPGSPGPLAGYGWRWERCRASAFRPPAGGHQTHSVNHSKLTEVGTTPTLRSRHLGGPASHLSFNPRPQAGGREFLSSTAMTNSVEARIAFSPQHRWWDDRRPWQFPHAISR